MNTENNVSEKKQINHEEYLKLQQEFAEKQKDVEARLWLDSTISQFDNLLRLHYSKSTEEFAKIVIQHIAEISQAFMGVFYIFEKDAQLVTAIASYSCKIEKITQTQYQLGEGIIGQAAESKKMIYFDNLPSKSLDFNIVSVKVSAANMLILPLVFNEEVYGVLEILYLKPLEDKYLQFLQITGKNIASMLESIFNNALTKKLLSESQQQTEALRAQEEEMRQNLEELQTTQEEMHRKEVEINGVFAAINVALATVEFDMQGYILTVNERFIHLLGYSLEELKGKHHSILLDEQFAKSQAYANFWKELGEGIPQTDDFRRTAKDGKEVWLRASYTPVKDIRGNYFKIIKLAQDITEKKLAEIEAYRLSLVADNTDNSVIITDKDGEIEYVNQGFIKMTGYTFEEIKGKKPGSFLQGPETNQNTVQRIREKLNTRKSFYEEILNYKKNGETYWISLAINPVFNKNGGLEKYVAVQANITETKLQAVDFSSKLEAIDKSYGVVEFDTKGHILKANDNFLKIVGYTMKELQGKHHEMLVTETERKSKDYQHFWKKLGKDGGFVSGEFTRIAKDGNKVWLKGSYNSILDLQGKPYKVVKYAQDITQQKMLETANQQQNEELRAQEEELRQNMEELQATQEEMFRKQAQLNAQISALDDSKILRIEFSPEGLIKEANPAFYELFGYTPEEVQNKHHKILVQQEYAKSKAYEIFWEELRAGKSQPGEYLRVTKDDQIKWLSATYSPIFNKDGKVAKVLKIALDITDMKQLVRESQQQNEELSTQEEELRQNMEELQSTQDELQKQFSQVNVLKRDLEARANVFDIATILSEADLFGNILYVNQKLIDVSQYTKEELIGKPHNMLRHPDMPKAVFKVFWETIQSGKIFRGIVKNRKKDGTHYWVDAVVSPVMDENNKPIKYIGVRYLIEEDALAEKLYQKMLTEMGIRLDS